MIHSKWGMSDLKLGKFYESQAQGDHNLNIEIGVNQFGRNNRPLNQNKIQFSTFLVDVVTGSGIERATEGVLQPLEYRTVTYQTTLK